MILETFFDAEYNIQTEVASMGEGRYSVVLRDLDCDQVLSHVLIFHTLEEAVAEARCSIGDCRA